MVICPQGRPRGGWKVWKLWSSHRHALITMWNNCGVGSVHTFWALTVMMESAPGISCYQSFQSGWIAVWLRPTHSATCIVCIVLPILYTIHNFTPNQSSDVLRASCMTTHHDKNTKLPDFQRQLDTLMKCMLSCERNRQKPSSKQIEPSFVDPGSTRLHVHVKRVLVIQCAQQQVQYSTSSSPHTCMCSVSADMHACSPLNAVASITRYSCFLLNQEMNPAMALLWLLLLTQGQ